MGLSERIRPPDGSLPSVGQSRLLTAHGSGGSGHDGADSERDLALARQISTAARELGAAAAPAAVQTVQIAIDALDIPGVMPFWRAVPGYRQVGGEDLVDPHRRSPSIWFQQSSQFLDRFIVTAE